MTEVFEGLHTHANAGFIAMYIRIDCASVTRMLKSNSGDTVLVGWKASVTDYAVDDPDSSYCTHVNSVLGADQRHQRHDSTALFQSHVMSAIQSPESVAEKPSWRASYDRRRKCSEFLCRSRIRRIQ